MASRGNGTLITHYNTSSIPPSLMPGYCGHVPTTKFHIGETFGNSTQKYFQNVRSAILTSSRSSMTMTTLRSNMHDHACIMPYWIRHNIDFERQKEIKDFNMFSQIHRENYKDRTGTVQPVNYFIIPAKEKEKKAPELI